MRAKLVNEENFERGQDPKFALDIGLVSKIAKETGKSHSEGGAYSFDAYGQENWKNIIEWLLSEGYTEDEIVQVLRSKLMRWASDRSGDYGNTSLEDFQEYNNERTKGEKTLIERFLDEYMRFNEEMGGTSAPMGNLGNTPGVGNAQPAGTAAMTGSQQGSSSAIGSGDKWDASIGPMHKQNESLNEMNINPHDKLGVAMAKKMGIEIPFKKGKGDKDVEQKRIDEDPDLSSEIITFEEWEKRFLGDEHNPSILKNKYQ